MFSAATSEKRILQQPFPAHLNQVSVLTGCHETPPVAPLGAPLGGMRSHFAPLKAPLVAPFGGKLWAICGHCAAHVAPPVAPLLAPFGEPVRYFSARVECCFYLLDVSGGTDYLQEVISQPPLFALIRILL